MKDFLIGADPEFLCVDKKYNRVVQASQFVKGNDRFGMDGNQFTFEARPIPSKNPLVVVNNIREIFLKKIVKDDRFCDYDWYSGSYYHCGPNDTRDFPLGGHIHFGIKENQIKFPTACSILDNYVGLVSVLLEDKDDGYERRSDGDYGFASDFRPQDYGFEYRTPSSWLSSPYIASGMLCLSKMVMFETLNNPKFVPRQNDYGYEFEKMKKDSLREDFPDAWADIQKMSLYNDYKPYVDLLYKLIKEKRIWSTPDMRQPWGMFNLNRINKSQVPLEVVWNRFL